MANSDREKILSLYKSLRVADVRDGLDTLMMHATGTVSSEIRPLWRTRAFGIAKTARYVPYDGPPLSIAPEKYWEWVGWYYKEVCPYPFAEDIQPGDFVVIDLSGLDVGLLGSNNTLAMTKSGAAGFLTNGGIRDTDEIIMQKIPCWSKTCAQPMPQMRLRYESKDKPVSIGGVTVNPGDVVVADGDGVVVVPRRLAADAAKWGNEEHQRDIKARRGMYEALGMPLDESVR